MDFEKRIETFAEWLYGGQLSRGIYRGRGKHRIWPSLEAGARLVIVNHGETPLDRYAHLRFHENAGTVLPMAVKS